jgi:hypothetical protein
MEPPVKLAACTMVAAMDNMRTNTLNPDRIMRWISYHRNIGVSRFTIYIDVMNNKESLPLVRALRRSPNTDIVPWTYSIKQFSTQQLMENHCLYRYRNSAQWLLHTDVDEFVVTNRSLLGTLSEQLENKSIAAIQVKNRFCKCDGKCGPILSRGHEKLIMNPLLTDYFSVHMVTTSNFLTHTAKEMVLNHFRGCSTVKTIGTHATPVHEKKV